MDNGQNCDSYVNIPLSQTCTSPLTLYVIYRLCFGRDFRKLIFSGRLVLQSLQPAQPAYGNVTYILMSFNDSLLNYKCSALSNWLEI
jgi:hypothetical protein